MPYGATVFSAAGAEAIVLVRENERLMDTALDLKESEILGNLNPRKRRRWEMYNIDDGDSVRVAADRVAIIYCTGY